MDETTWVCPTCTEVEAEKEKRKLAPKGTGTEVEYVMSANNNKGPIRVLQWNADSLRSKKEEFKLFLKKWEVDVFLIQETKMTSKESQDTRLYTSRGNRPKGAKKTEEEVS